MTIAKSLRNLLGLVVLSGGVVSLNCSVPNLETTQCQAAKTIAKEFYSFHFANEMKFSLENLKLREKFLAPELFKSLGESGGEADVFTTKNTDYPKAFRIGACKADDSSKATVDVILFWKTDTRTEQKEIKVEAVKQNDKWLIRRIGD